MYSWKKLPGWHERQEVGEEQVRQGSEQGAHSKRVRSDGRRETELDLL